jgi:predicted nucleotidyltransferase
MDLYDKFNQVISTFNNHKVEYILIGGYAVILYGYLRGTEDIDFFVNPTEENFLNLRSALHELFQDNSIEELTLKDSMQYSVTRYNTPDGFFIDIITTLGAAFHYNDIKFNELQNEQGTRVRIADIESLIEMKKSTFREKDIEDIFFLVRRRDADAG